VARGERATTASRYSAAIDFRATGRPRREPLDGSHANASQHVRFMIERRGSRNDRGAWLPARPAAQLNSARAPSARCRPGPQIGERSRSGTPFATRATSATRETALTACGSPLIRIPPAAAGTATGVPGDLDVGNAHEVVRGGSSGGSRRPGFRLGDAVLRRRATSAPGQRLSLRTAIIPSRRGSESRTRPDGSRDGRARTCADQAPVATAGHPTADGDRADRAAIVGAWRTPAIMASSIRSR
jgi:hypothetical protein